MNEFSLIAFLTPLFSMVMIGHALSLFQKGRQTWRELLLWLIIWMGIGMIALWPDVLDYLPPYVGIKSGVNILIFFGFVVLFYGFFRLFTKVEQLERKFVELNQELAEKNAEVKTFDDDQPS